MQLLLGSTLLDSTFAGFKFSWIRLMLDSRVLLLVFAEKRTTAMTLARLTSCRHDDSRNTVSYMSVCSSFLRFHQPRFVCDHMTSSDFDALTAHLTALQEPSWPPLRGHRLAMQGIAERMEMLYRDLQWWTELDLRLKDVDWSASGISRWPLDVWCVFSSAQDLCLVGNVNTASRLEDVGRIYGLRVTGGLHAATPRDEDSRCAVGLGDVLRRAVYVSCATSFGRWGGSHWSTAAVCSTVYFSVAKGMQRPLATQNEHATQ